MSDRLRVTIVGLGMAHKPHLQSLRELGYLAEIAACHAPSAARRQEFSEKNPDLPIAAELDMLLLDKTIDVVILLTPPTTHLDLVERCAAAGKHVLLEKPIEVSVERARRAVEIMSRAQLTFGVVLQHRFRAAARKLRRLVQSGELGRLLSASASIRWWRAPEYLRSRAGA
jgi:UDP-N-acetyl-2-amino-2-deoxyglucuronate dehydrogenase